MELAESICHPGSRARHDHGPGRDEGMGGKRRGRVQQGSITDRPCKEPWDSRVCATYQNKKTEPAVRELSRAVSGWLANQTTRARIIMGVECDSWPGQQAGG